MDDPADHSDFDDYDDVEYINVKYMRPPPSRAALIEAQERERKQRNSSREVADKELQTNNRINSGVTTDNKQIQNSKADIKDRSSPAAIAERIQQFENY